MGLLRKGFFLLLAGALGACGGSASTLDHESDSSKRGSDDMFGGRPAGGASPSGTGPGAADGGAPAPLPPEREERREFEAPRAGARYVYVANPRRDTVAVIDSTTLAIRSVPAGDGPTHLRTLPGRDVALVINVGSRDVTILRTEADGTRTSTVPVVAGANQISVAPGGRHALVWHASAARAAAPGSVAGSFQDVSVVTMGEPDTAVPMTVGFRPSQVEFSRDGAAAFVITEDGVSVIRFDEVRGPRVAPLVALGDPAGPVARDVAITPDGRHAIARRDGSSHLHLVDLSTRQARSVDLGAPVTDLDLSPDGDFALAVLREARTVVRLAIPAGFEGAAGRQVWRIEGETVGSAALTPDGRTAVLYTTAAPVERLVILDLASAEPPRAVRLKKGVRAVAVSPDSRIALVVHTKEPGDPRQPGIDLEVLIDRSHGYSVVDLRSGFTKLQLTDAPVGELAITPDAARAFVLLRDDVQSIRVAQRIHLESFLIDDFVLGSPPLAIAALAESRRMFVSQLHPEGRISFIHWESGAVESVTGFELNGRIVQ